jgi:hypothetical protein
MQQLARDRRWRVGAFEKKGFAPRSLLIQIRDACTRSASGRPEGGLRGISRQAQERRRLHGDGYRPVGVST